MKTLVLLTKSIFLNSFRSEGKKLNQNGAAGMFLGSLIFGVMFVLMTIFLAPLFMEHGLEAEFFTMLMTASQLLILIFGSVLLINVLFFSRDAEFLLSLPVKTIHIFLAKLIYVYVSELLFCASLLLLSGITFGIIAGFGALNYALLLLSLFFVPILPLMLASILTIPAMLLAALLKGKSLLTTVILILGFAALMYLYVDFMGAQAGSSQDITLPAQAISATFENAYPNISMSRLVVLKSAQPLTDIIIVLGANAGLLLLSCILAATSFKKGMSVQLESPRASSSKKTEFKQSTAFNSFVSKEFKELLRSPGLAFYCLFQIVLAPIMLLFYGQTMSSAGASGEEMPEILGLMSTAMGMFFVTLMVCGMSYTALSSVSREGKNFHMSKTLPAPYSYQMAAKIRVADIIMLGGILISGLVMVILSRADVLQTLAFCGFGVILGNALNYFLALRDAKNPKLQWESITVALKNNTSALLSMGIAMLFAIPMIAGYIIITLAAFGPLRILLFALMWMTLYGAAIWLNYIFRKKMSENIERYIAQIE